MLIPIFFCHYLSLPLRTYVDLRVSGVYWSLAALSLLLPLDQVVEQMRVVVGKQDEGDKDNNSSSSSLLDWLFTCWDDKSGGFGGNSKQDAHLLYTLSAVQILALTGSLQDERLQTDRIVSFCVSLQQADGSFVGDAWGEVDTRFTYCALSTLSILGRLDAVRVEQAAAYICACRNLDGGFGCVIGAESHAGT